MAKKINAENLVEKELGNFQDKLAEFQRYLKDKNIITMVSDSGIDIAEDDQDKLHKEIVIQIKMQDSILGWLPLLKKLREIDQEKENVRGGIDVGGNFKD